MDESTRYFRLARKVVGNIRNISASKDESNSLRLNKLQSNRLSTKLQECILSIEGIMLSPAIQAQRNRPFLAALLREVWRIAKDAETLIRACCKPLWLKAAVLLGDSKESFFSLEFNLEVCKLMMNTAANYIIHNGGEAEISVQVGDTILEWELKTRSIIRAIIQDLSLRDEKSLRESLESVLIQGSGDSALDVVEACELASKLLQRLEHETKSRHMEAKKTAENVRRGYLWRIDRSHLRDHTGSPICKSSSGGIEVLKTTWLGDTYVRKVFHGQGMKESFEAEATIVAGLFHPNLLPTVCVCVDSQGCSLVMELMDGDLYTFLRDRTSPVPLLVAVDIMLQIAEAMAFMHEQRVVHMDLKSPNILIRPAAIEELAKEGYVIAKVADFGQSKSKLRSSTQSPHDVNVGTTRWMAPELFKPHVPGSWRKPFKVDMYSFGITCYELMSRNQPFHDIPNKEVKKLVCSGVRPTLPETTPLPLTSLIKQCWDGDARKRPSFPIICTKLRYIKCILLTGGGVESIKINMNQCTREKSLHRLNCLRSCFISSFKDHTPQTNGYRAPATPPVSPTESHREKNLLEMKQPPTSLIKSCREKDLMEMKQVIPNMNFAAQAHRDEASTSRDKMQQAEDISIPRIQRSWQDTKGQTSGSTSNSAVDPQYAYFDDETLHDTKHNPNVERAMDDLSKAILLEPTALMYFLRGQLKERKGDLHGALEDLNIAIKSDSTDALWFLVRGNIYLQLNEKENAYKDYSRSYELEPNQTTVLMLLAGMKATTEDDHTSALHYLNRAIEVASRDPRTGTKQLSTLYYLRGVEKRDMEDLQGALEDFQHSSRLNPIDVSCLMEISDIKIKFQKDFEGVLAVLDRVIEMQPGNVLGYCQRVLAKRNLHDLPGALSDVNAAATLLPNNPSILLLRALVLQDLAG